MTNETQLVALWITGKLTDEQGIHFPKGHATRQELWDHIHTQRTLLDFLRRLTLQELPNALGEILAPNLPQEAMDRDGETFVNPQTQERIDPQRVTTKPQPLPVRVNQLQLICVDCKYHVPDAELDSFTQGDPCPCCQEEGREGRLSFRE